VNVYPYKVLPTTCVQVQEITRPWYDNFFLSDLSLSNGLYIGVAGEDLAGKVFGGNEAGSANLGAMALPLECTL
jgi:hypothetical protein